MASRQDVAQPRGAVDGSERSGDAASPHSHAMDARGQVVTNAAQAVAQLQSLIARNPDLAGDLEDGLPAARAKLDQAAIDLIASTLAAGALDAGHYAEYRMDVLRAGTRLATRSAGDPIALAALDRAMRAMHAPDHLQEQLDIARVDLAAYEIVRTAERQPTDAGVVALKEADIARLESLVAGARAAQPCDSGRATDSHGGRIGSDAIDSPTDP